MERTEVLAQLLGVLHAYDDDSGLFLVCPDKLAFGVLASPLSGGDDSTASKLNLLLSLAWPDDTLIQVACYTSPDMVGITDAYESLRSGVSNPLLRRSTQEHVKFIRNSALQPYDPVSGARLRNSQLIITVQMPFKGVEPSEHALELARELRASFMQTLKSASVYAETLTARNYIRIMETILNQGQTAAWKKTPLVDYDPNELICTQVLDPGSAVDVDENGLWLNGSTRVRVLSPKRYPDMPYFGLALRYLIDPEHGARGIRENTLITMNILLPNRKADTDKLERSEVWNNHQASTPISKYVRYFKEKRDSLQAILGPVRDGDRPVKAYISMALLVHGDGNTVEDRKATERRATAAVANAQSYWREFGYHMLPESSMVVPFFFQMLPFAGDASMRQALERYRPMAGIHATCLAPYMGSWRGTGTPVLTLFARDGQIQPISPWDTDGGMNFMISAATGRGKSVFAQALIQAITSIGGKAWVIDVGASYKNLCENNGGQYISFEKGSQIKLPIFEGVYDFEDQVDMITELFAIMITQRNDLTTFQLSYLKSVIEECWSRTGQQTTIDHVRDMLASADRQDITDLAMQLRSFTSDGTYGHYFNGKGNVNFDADMVVIELGDLKSKPALQRVVLLTLMNRIGKEVYLGDRTRKQMLLIDEAWELLSGDDTATFVEKAYRQFRKHGASIGCITQSVLDIWDSKGGRAMADNTSHFYLLGQKEDSIEAIRDAKRLPGGDWAYNMLKTVHTLPAQYAEIMCMTPRGTGIGRLVLNNFEKVMFSTSPPDVVAIRNLRERGLSLEEAVNQIVRERYGEGNEHSIAMPAASVPRGREVA
ncbi:TraC family protein [Luteimonas sp. MHLX1A]|uniref:TraC family protein n=1 Tax=Alterluteimonas muca TaxID=2878684 RepID=UPI001E50FE59|nr:TraC family protein [Luteimonas sp. MHLX1A]MCD9046902.1 TraC family protein [Luteimonas sp. MHLX1A]